MVTKDELIHQDPIWWGIVIVKFTIFKNISQMIHWSQVWSWWCLPSISSAKTNMNFLFKLCTSSIFLPRLSFKFWIIPTFHFVILCPFIYGMNFLRVLPWCYHPSSHTSHTIPVTALSFCSCVSKICLLRSSIKAGGGVYKRWRSLRLHNLRSQPSNTTDNKICWKTV